MHRGKNSQRNQMFISHKIGKPIPSTSISSAQNTDIIVETAYWPTVAEKVNICKDQINGGTQSGNRTLSKIWTTYSIVNDEASRIDWMSIGVNNVLMVQFLERNLMIFK